MKYTFVWLMFVKSIFLFNKYSIDNLLNLEIILQYVEQQQLL